MRVGGNGSGAFMRDVLSAIYFRGFYVNTGKGACAFEDLHRCNLLLRITLAVNKFLLIFGSQVCIASFEVN